MTEWIPRPAEFVLPGHPDKLLDAIADSLVAHARARQQRALVGVEVAAHRDAVFVDGRIACRGASRIPVARIVRSIYAEVGYGREFPPAPRAIEVSTDLCRGPLRRGESEVRGVADDQSIVTGYACTTPGTGFLPVEQALASRLARRLDALRRSETGLRLGPDGKLLVLVEESPDARRWRLGALSISIQHAEGADELALRRALRAAVTEEMRGFGALSGKDFYKADRAGAILARRLAVHVVQRAGVRECTAVLAIEPGETAFRVLGLQGPECGPLDRERWTAGLDLTLASVGDTVPAGLDLVAVARHGHFTDPDLPWERSRPPARARCSASKQRPVSSGSPA